MSEYTNYNYDYLTFPLEILKIDNIKQTTRDAMAFCLYNESREWVGAMPKSDYLKITSNKLGLKYGDVNWSYNRGKELFSAIPNKSPKTSIRRKMMLDFHINDKTEYEVVVFFAFAAIKSILQKQAYTKITNDYLLGRMAGTKKGEDLPAWIEKYKTRYQLDKIKNELQRDWGLKLYGYHTRGFYVSFKMELKDLIKQAELKKNKVKEQQLADLKKEARKQALAEIYHTNTMRAVG